MPHSRSCRTTETALNIGRYKRKEVATSPTEPVFSFVKVWPVKRGRSLVKAELFLEK